MLSGHVPCNTVTHLQFCFMISSIAAFNGYYAKGGSLGVGRSSTKAIVTTSILILLADLIVTQLMLY